MSEIMTKDEKDAIELVKEHGTMISYALRIYVDLLEFEEYERYAGTVNGVADMVDDVFMRLAAEE